MFNEYEFGRLCFRKTTTIVLRHAGYVKMVSEMNRADGVNRMMWFTHYIHQSEKASMHMLVCREMASLHDTMFHSFSSFQPRNTIQVGMQEVGKEAYTVPALCIVRGRT